MSVNKIVIKLELRLAQMTGYRIFGQREVSGHSGSKNVYITNLNKAFDVLIHCRILMISRDVDSTWNICKKIENF